MILFKWNLHLKEGAESGVLSDLVQNINKKEADKVKIQAENKDNELKNPTVDITETQKQLEQKINSAQGDFFAMHFTSCDFRGSKCHGQKDHENVNSDSGAVTGLEIWC